MVKDHISSGHFQYLIQKACMVIMGMCQKYVLNLIRPDMVFLQHLHKTRKSSGIAGIDQYKPVLVWNQVIIHNPIANVVDHVSRICFH